MEAAVKVFALWGVAASTLWLHALLGIPGEFLGQLYPFEPGLTNTPRETVSPFSLAVESVWGSLPIFLLAALAGEMRLRALAIAVITFFWLIAAWFMIGTFQTGAGNTWQGLEPFYELILPAFDPFYTAAALLVLALTTWWALTPQRGPQG